MAQPIEHTVQAPPAIEDVYPLTPLQAGMLFHTLYAPGAQVYVNQYVFSLRGGPDAAALRSAWQEVLGRHPVLRTVFLWESLDRPLQVVHRGATLPWAERDWRSLPRDAQRSELKGYLEADRERGFDLTEPPLMRVALLRMADDEWELVWSYHHLLFDGWSIGLILRDVFALYEASLRGTGPALPRTRPYRDYVAWLQQRDMSEAEGFWRGTLEGFTAPTPLGIDRAAGGEPDGEPSFGYVERLLPAGTTAALHRFARRQRLTASTLWQGAWGVLLSRYSGEEDVVFGATVSGREAGLAGMDAMVGLFINTLPVRLEARGGARVGECLERLQAQQVEARQYDYSSLQQVQKWSGVPAGQPLFESIVVFENHPVWDEVGGGENGFRVEGWDRVGRSHYPLTLSVLPGERTSLRLAYDRRRVEGEAVERMAGHLQTLLEALAGDAGRRLAEVPLLPDAERRQLLEAWHGPEVGFGGEPLVHEMVRAQALRTPHATALVAADESLTDAELDRAANRRA
ncbi:MAG TPA: condensation domain-containing protein, partial [Longimicrobiaceae bacterium]|nr:condensation domain-containing protein [Longimicrobiaceae bacterium]